MGNQADIPVRWDARQVDGARRAHQPPARGSPDAPLWHPRHQQTARLRRSKAMCAAPNWPGAPGWMKTRRNPARVDSPDRIAASWSAVARTCQQSGLANPRATTRTRSPGTAPTRSAKALVSRPVVGHLAGNDLGVGRTRDADGVERVAQRLGRQPQQGRSNGLAPERREHGLSEWPQIPAVRAAEVRRTRDRLHTGVADECREPRMGEGPMVIASQCLLEG